MKFNLKKSKKVIFLIMVVFGANVQAKLEASECEVVSQNEVVVDTVILSEDVIVSEGAVEIDKVMVECVKIDILDDSLIVSANTLDDLAGMINDGQISTFNQFSVAAKNFPELVEAVSDFKKAGVMTNAMVISQFKSLKNQKAKQFVMSLLFKIKNKDNVWTIVKN